MEEAAGDGKIRKEEGDGRAFSTYLAVTCGVGTIPWY